MEDKRIKTVKKWREPKSMRDIQVFLEFANFYWRFLYGFSKIARPLTLMLRMSFTIRSAKNLSQINVAEDAEVGVGGGGDCDKKTVERSLSKNLIRAGYLTSNTKKAFNHFWHAFTKALIFQHFDPEHHI